MAVASTRFLNLFPLLLHSRFSSLHLLRRLAIRRSPHLLFSPSPSHALPRSCCQSSSLHSQPLKWEDRPNPFRKFHGDLNSWPEWLEFVNFVSSSGYSNNRLVIGDEFVEELNPGFLSIANDCLDFARNHPNLLWCLSREDIEVVVAGGSPFLFKDAFGTVKRMNCFLGNGLNDVLESDEPSMLDLMRFLLSYAHMAIVSSENNPIDNKVESSVRRLFGELVNSRGIYTDSNSSLQNLFPERNKQVPRSLGKNFKMKRGDWMCPRCNFMNFAKNLKCHECEEFRPKKLLTGGEWECPQCDFFNFGRNAVCLRCDCKKPAENPSQSLTPVIGVGDQSSAVEANMEMRSTGMVEQQWFTKITELEKSSGVSNSVEDDFFARTIAVGTGNMGDDEKAYDVNPETGTDIDNEINDFLDGVLNEKSTLDMGTGGTGLGDDKHQSAAKLTPDNYSPVHKHLNERSASQMENRETEQADGENLSGGAMSEEFLEIMPMREGENRFVVSKKKDRSLTSPMYKRRIALEQQAGNKYVPFVPFPPDYFSQEKFREGPYSSVSSPENNGGTSPANQHSVELNLNLGKQDDTTHPINNSSSNFEQNPSSDFRSFSPDTSATASEGDSSQLSENQSIWRGRSLEGSAVTEPDPLDMSEEAKAERWFRRVAQIKDISELSQIPDEDFPSIMPMRKGVNRFVVSKRKTPLERRLTSSRYQRNITGLNSDPAEKESDSNS